MPTILLKSPTPIKYTTYMSHVENTQILYTQDKHAHHSTFPQQWKPKHTYIQQPISTDIKFSTGLSFLDSLYIFILFFFLHLSSSSSLFLFLSVLSSSACAEFWSNFTCQQFFGPTSVFVRSLMIQKTEL